jgi:uncharacterized protein YecT (DUF1311 family)
MKHLLFTLACAAMLTQAPVIGQTQTNSYLNEKLNQRIQQLASAGAQAARKAYSTDGLYGVAKQSSDCMAATRSGKISSHHCLGIESVGLELRPKTPLNSNTKTALDWFNPKEMTNRINGHCYVFLGLRTDMECGQTFAIAKLASEQITAGLKLYKGDLTGDPVTDLSQQPKSHEEDRAMNVTNSSDSTTKAPSAENRPVNIESILAKYQTSFYCFKYGSSIEKMICGNANLGRLDGLLNATYKSRLDPKFGADPSEMRNDQRSWISERNKCSDLECVEKSYVTRIKLLCAMPVTSGVRLNSDCDALGQD